MKKLVLTLAILIVGGFLFAQEDEGKMETLIKSYPKKIRGFIGINMCVTTLAGETAYMQGFSASGIINDHYLLGFYSSNLENSMYSNNDNYIGAEMNYSHNGISLGYILFPKKAIHFSTSLMAGKGDLDIYDDIADEWIEDKVIFILTPNIEAEFNVFRFLRIGVGANYQFAFDVDRFDGYDDKDFSSPGGYVSLKFGWFN